MRILFFGSQNIGYLSLHKLLQKKQNVVGVVTFKPAPHENWQRSVDEIANQRNIPLHFAEDLKIDDYLTLTTQTKPDVIVIVGWRRLLTPILLSTPRYGCVGLHASLLPKYRGHAPINWAMIRGEKKTGITLLKMDEGIDTGDILAQKSLTIGEQDFTQIKEKIDRIGASLIADYVPKIKTLKLRKQVHAKASYGCPREPQDGLIDWNQPSVNVLRLIRAVTRPYPGAFSFYDGKKVFIWSARLYSGKMQYYGLPGSIASLDKTTGVMVMCADAPVVLELIQEDGKPDQIAVGYFKSIRKRFGDKV